MFPADLKPEDVFPHGVGEEILREVIYASEEEFFGRILPFVNKLRELAFGNEVSFCSIVNAKSGACVETCNFCSQSASFKGAQTALYPLMSSDEIVKKAKEAEGWG